MIELINAAYPGYSDIEEEDVPIMIDLLERGALAPHSDKAFCRGDKWKPEDEKEIVLARDELHRALANATPESEKAKWQPWARAFTKATGYIPIYWRYAPWVTEKQRKFCEEIHAKNYISHKHQKQFTKWLLKEVGL